MTAAPALEAELTVRVGEFEVQASLQLDDGMLVFFGPSGAGKSLTLKALAGLVRPVSGFIRVGGEVLFDSAKRIDVPAHRRRIGYVPQDALLLPFRTVEKNILFGVPRPRRRAAEAKLNQLCAELGLTELRGALPPRLSGGERQRVALARALAVEPRLLLLDEPFASIDLEGRTKLRESLRSTLSHHATPAVFVTHDPQEALALADRVVRFTRGRTVATGPASAVLASHVPLSLGLRERTLEKDDDGGSGSGRLTASGVTLSGPIEALERIGDSVLVRLERGASDSSEE